MSINFKVYQQNVFYNFLIAFKVFIYFCIAVWFLSVGSIIFLEQNDVEGILSMWIIGSITFAGFSGYLFTTYKLVYKHNRITFVKFVIASMFPVLALILFCYIIIINMKLGW